MNKVILNTDFSSVPTFADEVRSAFDTQIPPIVFSIDNRENLDLFSQVFQTDKPGMGRRVSCKRATNGSALNFSPREIFNFGDEQFPIVFSFKNIRDVEDFANGWSRLQESSIAEKKEVEVVARQKAEEDKIKAEEEIEEKKGREEKDAKLEELNEQVKTTQERIAMIAEKFLDGELSREEKDSLTERYSRQLAELRAQINELGPASVEKPAVPNKDDFKEQRVLPGSGETSKSEPKDNKKVHAPMIIVGIVAAIIAFFAINAAVSSIRQANYEKELQERREYERTHPSNYKKLLDALESGKVRYGMTYQQIANIVGEANSVSRSNGVIEFAYYRRSSAYTSSDATRIQLCFRNGRLDHWND